MLKGLFVRFSNKNDSIEDKLSSLTKARENAVSVFANIKNSLVRANEELLQVRESATQKADHYLILAGDAEKSINDHEKLIERLDQFLV